MEPDERLESGTKTWLVRSQNLILAYSQARRGTVFTRTDQPDEFTILLPSPVTRATIRTPDAAMDVSGEAIVVVSADSSELSIQSDCEVVRLYSCRSTDLLERCRNASAYVSDDPNIAPFAPWSQPTEGASVRVYAPGEVAADPARFGRIYRTSTTMVNYFEPEHGPRSPDRMSPHHHADFEQVSLQLAGDYVHHLRTPWGLTLADWRADEHRACSSPAALIIPPPLVHTSQAIGHQVHQLVDIFCPPRHDFYERPGWVLNADEYPAAGPSDGMPGGRAQR